MRLEPVPWARAGSPYTRDFENVVAWLAQQMAKTPIAGLLRIGWDSVGRIVQRLMADRLDQARLDGLVAIGADEISYRRGQRYLTCVADHRTGAIVWCAPGRNSATLQGFFDELSERKASIRAVSIDMSGEYQRAIRAAIPHAEVCFDPFHVCRLASRATDQVRRNEWNAHRHGILAAIRLGLSNGRLEGLNSQIRLISHRSYGFHSAAALIALVYLCCTDTVIDLPR